MTLFFLLRALPTSSILCPRSRILFSTMVAARKKTGIETVETVETVVKAVSTITATKRSASPSSEASDVKKIKATPKKKATWEPFDPSLPNNMTFPTEFTIPAKPEGSIKIVSYNVASLAACIKKGFNRYIDAEDADIVCVQEHKLNAPLSSAVNDKVYKYRYWAFDEKKGYGNLIYIA
jgi:hypothetical protein